MERKKVHCFKQLTAVNDPNRIAVQQNFYAIFFSLQNTHEKLNKYSISDDAMAMAAIHSSAHAPTAAISFHPSLLHFHLFTLITRYASRFSNASLCLSRTDQAYKCPFAQTDHNRVYTCHKLNRLQFTCALEEKKTAERSV